MPNFFLGPFSFLFFWNAAIQSRRQRQHNDHSCYYCANDGDADVASGVGGGSFSMPQSFWASSGASLPSPLHSEQGRLLGTKLRERRATADDDSGGHGAGMLCARLVYYCYRNVDLDRDGGLLQRGGHCHGRGDGRGDDGHGDGRGGGRVADKVGLCRFGRLSRLHFYALIHKAAMPRRRPQVVELPTLFLDFNQQLKCKVDAIAARKNYPFDAIGHVDPTAYASGRAFMAKMMTPGVQDNMAAIGGSMNDQIEMLAIYLAVFLHRYGRDGYALLNLQRSGIRHAAFPAGVTWHAGALIFRKNGTVELFELRGNKGPFGGHRYPERRAADGWHNLDFYKEATFVACLRALLNKVNGVLRLLAVPLTMRLEPMLQGPCFRTLVTPQLASDRRARGASTNNCREGTLLYVHERCTHMSESRLATTLRYMKQYAPDYVRLQRCLAAKKSRR
jgi:hypothetical protein